MATPAEPSLAARLLSIDARSLAATRIAAAAILLADLASRARDLTAHYTDAGIMPREAAGYLSSLDHGFPLSIHALGGSAAFEAVLFAAAAVFAGMLLIGWRTRVATVASWLLLVSLHNRTPQVLIGGDHLLRQILFWSMFVPWGSAFSLDARGKPAAPPVRSAAALALLFQPAVVYFEAFVTKTSMSWRQGFAVQYVLGVEPYVTSFGRWLQPHPGPLRLLTWGVLLFEMAAPLLLFFPRRTPAIRTATVAMISAMQLGFALCLRVGLFPWAGTAAVLPFLPAEFWDRFSPRATAPPPEWRWTRSNIAGVALGAYLLLWNAAFLLPSPARAAGFDRLRWIGYLPRLDQGWAMFAPELPTRLDGWFLAPADAGGTPIDLVRSVFEGREVPFSVDKPDRPWRIFDLRWDVYLQNARAWEDDRPFFARWLCRRWNETHPDRAVHETKLVWIQEQAVLNVADPPASPEELWSGSCD